MKTYRHKKTDNLVILETKDKMCIGVGIMIPLEMVEGSDDWVEIKEEEVKFEIIRYKDSAGNEYYKKHNGKFTINLQYEYDDEKLFNKNLKIQTIKRLSDGVNFSVGDKVVWDTIIFKNNNKDFIKIESIVTSGKSDDYVLNERWSANNTSQAYNLRHYEEKPVYLSSDGYDIFEDDEFHAVQKESFNVVESCQYPITDADKWLIFKQKTKMYEYIWLNKPCLSINDVAKVYVTANRKYLKRPSGWEKQAEQLIDLVKTKLKS